MDIFKQKRYLFLVIIVLIVLNMATLVMLWLGGPQRPAQHRGPGRPKQERAQIQRLLKNELGFDDKQAEQYLKLRQEHREQTRQLNDEMRRIKKQMFDEVLEDIPQPMLSDSLLKLTQKKQSKIEQLTYQHFLDLKKLCKPEQKDKLKLLMHEMFRGQPAGKREGLPPPPPDGERLSLVSSAGDTTSIRAGDEAAHAQERDRSLLRV